MNRIIIRNHPESTTSCDSNSSPCSKYFSWKSIVDWILGVVLLVFSLPAIGVLMAIVRLTSSGPGLFRQVRTGKDGKSFTMYKIRTMTKNAEEQTGPIWARIKDSRVTPVGRFLRKLHLDELPQLFNVLKGEMSLVGPRPERPEFVDMLAEQISGYKNRLAAKPGITGLAQLNLPPDSDLNSVRRKLVLDLQYLRQGTLFLDIRIILCTGLRIFKLSEGISLRFFGLGRSISQEQLEYHMPPLGESTGKRLLKLHAAHDSSIEDEYSLAFSMKVVEFVKHLLHDEEIEGPEINRYIEDAIQGFHDSALQHSQSNSEVGIHPDPVSE
ncbi:MAG: sugar transferase [Pirellulales bacterium]|nr:sugar transferase [Pirellulales bacterium]